MPSRARPTDWLSAPPAPAPPGAGRAGPGPRTAAPSLPSARMRTVRENDDACSTWDPCVEGARSARPTPGRGPAQHGQDRAACRPASLTLLRILLAEEVAMVRGALVALIELEPDLKVVAAIERGDYIVSATLAHHPDVAIIDIDLPGLDGLTAPNRLHAPLPSFPPLGFTN